MKLLYLVHQFFPRHHYGTEKFTLELARQMQRMGHCPTVVTYEPSKDVENFEKLTNDVLINRYSYRGIPVIALKHTNSADSSRIFDLAIEDAGKVLDLKCDLVHVCHPMWLSSLAMTCKKNSTPIVMTLTDAWLLCPGGLVDRGFRLCSGPNADGGCSSCRIGSGMRPRLEQAKTVYDTVDQVTSPSRFIPRVFERNGWTRKVAIIPHGINYADIKYPRSLKPHEVTFGYIGSIVWHKGAHVLIKAVRGVSRSNFRVKVYGRAPGEELDYYKALVSLARGDERIEFMGFFEDRELADIMSGLSALVIPSTYYENYPLVMLTALAYRLPLIVSDIGGMPEIVKDEYNGFLFKTGDHIQLAGILERIVKEPSLLDKVQANITPPRRTEEEALDYENIYMKLLAS